MRAMLRVAAWSVAATLLALCTHPVAAAPESNAPGLARQLLQGCLEPPNVEEVARLAQAVGAKPFSEARQRREVGKRNTTVIPVPSEKGQAQRTQTTVIAFRGWDLPGDGGGSLEFQEEMVRIDWIEQSTGQSVSAVRASHDRDCRVEAPVVNGRAIFELYETLHDHRYGILISADRRRIAVFVFDPEHFDTELSIFVDKPIGGLAPAAEKQGMTRLVLTDGGPRFINEVSPGVATVSLTRADLLKALDGAATMALDNSVIERVVQRIASGPSTGGTGPAEAVGGVGG